MYRYVRRNLYLGMVYAAISLVVMILSVVFKVILP
jgi:hypothetical protein